MGRGSGTLCGLSLLAVCATAWSAPTPVEQLAKPPADAEHFTVLSTAGKHGESTRWVTADGVRMGRESIVLRGQVFEVDSAARLGKDGMLESVTVRGFTPNGDASAAKKRKRSITEDDASDGKKAKSTKGASKQLKKSEPEQIYQKAVAKVDKM